MESPLSNSHKGPRLAASSYVDPGSDSRAMNLSSLSFPARESDEGIELRQTLGRMSRYFDVASKGVSAIFSQPQPLQVTTVVSDTPLSSVSLLTSIASFASSILYFGATTSGMLAAVAGACLLTVSALSRRVVKAEVNSHETYKLIHDLSVDKSMFHHSFKDTLSLHSDPRTSVAFDPTTTLKYLAAIYSKVKGSGEGSQVLPEQVIRKVNEGFAVMAALTPTPYPPIDISMRDTALSAADNLKKLSDLFLVSKWHMTNPHMDDHKARFIELLQELERT